MSPRKSLTSIDDLKRVIDRLKSRELQAFEKEILAAERVFVTGVGRSGLMARGFAMRLMHLGVRVFHVGDVITPSIQKGDLLVLCTRTGRSKVLSHYISIARKAKARVAAVTTNPEGLAGKRADVILRIDDRTVARARQHRPLPLGSLFEQALLITLDHVVLNLMETLDLSDEDLARIHTDFE